MGIYERRLLSHRSNLEGGDITSLPTLDVLVQCPQQMVTGQGNGTHLGCRLQGEEMGSLEGFGRRGGEWEFGVPF